MKDYEKAEQAVKLLEESGVEVGKEFKTKTNNQVFYKIDSDGTVSYLCKNEWLKSARELTDLLNGELEIVKLPWKPKEKEQYWSFITKYKDNHNVIWNVGDFIFRGNCYDCAALKTGWVFRTKAEAEAALPKVAEELGVEYEL